MRENRFILHMQTLPEADESQLKALFRAWSQKLHPDKGGDEALFVALQKEYEDAQLWLKNQTENASEYDFAETENFVPHAQLLLRESLRQYLYAVRLHRTEMTHTLVLNALDKLHLAWKALFPGQPEVFGEGYKVFLHTDAEKTLRYPSVKKSFESLLKALGEVIDFKVSASTGHRTRADLALRESCDFAYDRGSTVMKTAQRVFASTRDALYRYLHDLSDDAPVDL